MKWLKLIGQILVLTGKTGVIGVRYLVYRRRGLSAFEKELSRMGLDKAAVQELRQSYKSIGDVRRLANIGMNKRK
jgi:hypothetical protein